MGREKSTLEKAAIKVKARFAAKVKSGGGGRTIALRYARQQGFNVPSEQKYVVRKKKRKKKRVRTKVVYVYK